jgi:hypothetical protein
MARSIIAIAAFALPLGLAAACSGATDQGDLFGEADGAVVTPPDNGGGGGGGGEAGPDTGLDATKDVIAKDVSNDTRLDSPIDAPTDSCAVDCKGNPCAVTVCLPLTITSASPGAYYVLVDAVDVFWGEIGHAETLIDPDRIAKTKKTGGAVVVPLDTQAGAVTGLVLDDTSVSWLRTGKNTCVVRSSAKDGTGVTTPGLVTFGACEYRGIDVDATLLYVGANGGVRTFKRSALLTAGDPLVAAMHVGDLVLGPVSLYVADDKASTILTVDPTDGTVDNESATPLGATQISLSGGYVYFAMGTSVGRMKAGGGAVEDIATGVTGAEGVVVANGQVYFTTLTTVERAAVGSNVHTSIATGLTKAGRLAADAEYVYVADTTAGKILRLVQ